MPEQGAKSSQVSPPAGTGQMPGLGEAFQINLNTGQGVYSYKLTLPDGVAGHTPSLALEYAHGHGHGTFGFGWRLDQRRIGRRLDYGTADGAVERFHDSGTEFVPIAGGGFAPMRETLFTRYSRRRGGWRIEERNGLVHQLGQRPAGRLTDPDRPSRVVEWLLESTVDPCGNAIDYSYQVIDGTAYLTEIRYAAYAVRLLYQDRPDLRTNGRTGYLRRVAKRCSRIELFLDPGPQERRIRSWTFGYVLDPTSEVSLLQSIQIISHGAGVGGAGDVVRPPVVFTHGKVETDKRQVQSIQPEGPVPPTLEDPDVALVTLDDAPLPGILQVVNGRQYYWRNRGDGTWGWPEPVTRTPRVASFGRGGIAFLDTDASGTADLVVAGNERLPGYYENGGRGGWARFVAYARDRRARPAWSSAGTHVTDIDGDGRIDAIGESGRAYAVWINEGEDGWSQPGFAPKGSGDDGPDVPLDDPFVHLADMTGDGLQDIVRVRSGRVEYWPAVGRGRYGARVVMRNSPRLRDLHRLAENLFLIDIDGSGCADLVFASADGIRICHNRNGNAFSDPIDHDLVPTPIAGSVRPVDLFGEGRIGLLYNSYGARGVGYVYVSFGSAKPAYLLERVATGTGLESEISYRPGVQDYLRDLNAGEHWQTNFPFPFLVVAGTREIDQVTGQTVESEYRYHEAHYEPRTRQFQGFRLSERIEKGDESRSDTRSVFHFLMAQEREPGNGTEHAHLNGLMRRTEIFGLDGTADEDKPFAIEEANYDLQVLETTPDGRQRVFVFVTKRRDEDIECTKDVRGEERTYTYDATGNVTREHLRAYGTRGGNVQPERARITETEYATTNARWIIDKPSRITVRDDGGAILSEIRRYYDGPDFVGLALGDIDKGLMTREEHLVLPQAVFQARYAGMNMGQLGYHAGNDADNNAAVFLNAKQHKYSNKGLRTTDRDPVGNDNSYQFDPTGLFRVKLTDSLGETRFTYDRAVGEPLRIDYANGTRTTLTYDAQGRILSVTMPGEPAGQPTRAIRYDDTNIPTSRTTRFRTGTGPADVAESVMYFDGRGKDLTLWARSTRTPSRQIRTTRSRSASPRATTGQPPTRTSSRYGFSPQALDNSLMVCASIARGHIQLGHVRRLRLGLRFHRQRRGHRRHR